MTLLINGVPYTPESDIAAEIRAERDTRIAATLWMYERLARETRLGLTPTYTQSELDIYVQALADIPQQPGFPESVVWPTL